LAETNCTPFDFVEGDSELVTGCNPEYGGGGIALIFWPRKQVIFLSL